LEHLPFGGFSFSNYPFSFRIVLGWRSGGGKTGINRIWYALLSCSEESLSAARPERADVPEKYRKATRDGRTTLRPRSVHKGSKKDEILRLLRRPAGATLKNLMTITGWQAHSVRGFISAAVGKKMGLRVASSRREDGQRVYQVR